MKPSHLPKPSHKPLLNNSPSRLNPPLPPSSQPSPSLHQPAHPSQHLDRILVLQRIRFQTWQRTLNPSAARQSLRQSLNPPHPKNTSSMICRQASTPCTTSSNPLSSESILVGVILVLVSASDWLSSFAAGRSWKVRRSMCFSCFRFSPGGNLLGLGSSSSSF